MVRRAHLPSLQVCQDLEQQQRRDPERPLEPFRLKWNRSRHFAGSLRWTPRGEDETEIQLQHPVARRDPSKASAEQPGSAARPRRRATTHRTRARRDLELNGGAPSTAIEMPQCQPASAPRAPAGIGKNVVRPLATQGPAGLVIYRGIFRISSVIRQRPFVRTRGTREWPLRVPRVPNGSACTPLVE